MTKTQKTIITCLMLFTFTYWHHVGADTNTPRIDKRHQNQQERIEQGVSSGGLTPHEADMLEAQQDQIENAEARVKADGVVTSTERRRLSARGNRASRNIYRKKHNSRHR